MTSTKPKLVAYLRVSDTKQGETGLGIEAQREGIAAYCRKIDGEIIAEFVEVESGRRDDRPKLAAALKLCRIHAGTLAIYRLDRLARKVAFISALIDSGADVVVTSMPTINRLTLHILAAVAEDESNSISIRTKDAMRVARSQGAKFGAPQHLTHNFELGRQRSLAKRTKRADARATDLIDSIRHEQANGAATLRQIAAGLNLRGIPTVSKKGQWTPTGVKRVLERVAP